MSGRYRERVRTLLAAIALFVGASSAGPLLDQAATALRQDPVYVHPGAERSISNAEAEQIRTIIRDGDRAVYVAVLPTAAESEAPGGLNGLPAALGSDVGLTGTYAVVTGTGFRAEPATHCPTGAAAQMATNAFNDHKNEGVGAVLSAFAQRCAGLSRNGSSPVSSSNESSGGGGSAVAVVLVALVLGGVFLLFRSGAKRRKQEARVLAGDKADLQAELSVLADDVMRLEPEVSLHPEARDDYEAGVARYKWALAAVDSIDSIDDPPRVRRGMAEATYAMARAAGVGQGIPAARPSRRTAAARGLRRAGGRTRRARASPGIRATTAVAGVAAASSVATTSSPAFSSVARSVVAARVAGAAASEGAATTPTTTPAAAAFSAAAAAATGVAAGVAAEAAEEASAEATGRSRPSASGAVAREAVICEPAREASSWRTCPPRSWVPRR